MADSAGIHNTHNIHIIHMRRMVILHTDITDRIKNKKHAWQLGYPVAVRVLYLSIFGLFRFFYNFRKVIPNGTFGRFDTGQISGPAHQMPANRGSDEQKNNAQ